MIREVGVVGAGETGRGIVQSAASAGINVVFCETSEERVAEAIAAITAVLDQEIERWGLTKTEKTVILSRIRGVTSFEDLKSALMVIEAVHDDWPLKSKVFTALDRVLPPETILVTNTSSLSITQLAAQTHRPDRVVGMHFLLPVPKRPLVEVVRGLRTSDETVRRAKEFAADISKTAIEVFEYPGFVTTRLILPLLNEAMHVVMEGVASAADVDTAMTLGYNFPTGPLELADRIGLDEVLLWMEQLFRELGDLKYRPCPLLRKMVRAGHLGVKTGRGFFAYDERGKKKKES
ncbi:MAG: 3-hydroxyacyl-CoA dehydrogenase NAD-binding domain-containing protein [Candidatus Sumerlaeia bacterium]|nr:3-hydroxyacyl-CoA dehydrogenase NAD-binding domain-containing protein [Candidatus Sumerlaeia bacterium]